MLHDTKIFILTFTNIYKATFKGIISRRQSIFRTSQENRSLNAFHNNSTELCNHVSHFYDEIIKAMNVEDGSEITMAFDLNERRFFCEGT